MDANSTNSTAKKTRGRKRGRKSDNERAIAQEAFLAAFVETGIITIAAEEAGIDRKTVYDWQEHDEAFGFRFNEARERSNDYLRAEIHRRAVEGVEEPLVSNGHLVYEYEPVLTEDGKPVLDEKGKPVMQRGAQLKLRKYSDTLLIFHAKARMPEYRERQQVELSGQLDINGLAAEADARFYSFLAASSAAGVLGEPDGGSEG